MTDAVNDESVRWNKSLRSLDTRPLRAFIMKSIRSFIICISATMWGGNRICGGWSAGILPLLPARGDAAFLALLIPFFCAGSLLVFLLGVKHYIFLAQLFL